MFSRHPGNEAALQSINEICNGYREGLRGKALKLKFSTVAKLGNRDHNDSGFGSIIAIP